MQNSPNGEKPHLVILGGGLAGLSVARAALQTAECRVTLVEKQDRPGGMAVSLQLTEGVRADLGPHRIFSSLPEMNKWFQDVMSDRIFVVRRLSRMYVRGRFVDYPPRVAQLLRAFGFARLARFALGFAVERCRSLFPRSRDDSFAAAMVRAYGRPLCEALVFPYIRKTWKADPREVSVDAARVRATGGSLGSVARRMLLPGAEPEGNETSLQRFHYLKGGIESLPVRMACDIGAMGGRIVCGADVRRVVFSNGRIEKIVYTNPRGAEHVLAGDFFFSTIPLPRLVEISEGTGAPDDGARAAARNLEFLNIFLVYVILQRPSLSADHWLYFPESSPSVNRAYEPKNFDPSMAPPDQTVLCMEMTAAPGSGLWQASDEEIGRRAVAEVAATGLFHPSDVVSTHVHRLAYAYPLYRLGYRDDLGRIWESLRGISNLISLGRQGLFHHNNMDHSIHMGLRAVRRWSQEAAPVEAWFQSEVPRFDDYRIVD
ncbi:FAD-dependent oxidoreductase [Candidatus Sumerlaeota bacterium]|nr:FAD-dependent oxidoreductase [Candidatus Sumerlaeota bacterium]